MIKKELAIYLENSAVIVAPIPVVHRLRRAACRYLGTGDGRLYPDGILSVSAACMEHDLQQKEDE